MQVLASPTACASAFVDSNVSIYVIEVCPSSSPKNVEHAKGTHCISIITCHNTIIMAGTITHHI